MNESDARTALGATLRRWYLLKCYKYALKEGCCRVPLYCCDKQLSDDEFMKGTTAATHNVA